MLHDVQRYDVFGDNINPFQIVFMDTPPPPLTIINHLIDNWQTNSELVVKLTFTSRV